MTTIINMVPCPIQHISPTASWVIVQLGLAVLAPEEELTVMTLNTMELVAELKARREDAVKEAEALGAAIMALKVLETTTKTTVISDGETSGSNVRQFASEETRRKISQAMKKVWRQRRQNGNEAKAS